MGTRLQAPPVRDDGLLIGGSWRAAARSFERHNPARPGELVGRSAVATPEDVAAAYAAAHAAARPWRQTLQTQRGAILVRAAELIEQRVDALAAMLAAEEGKALRDARGEVRRAAAIFRFHGGESQQPIGEIYPSATAGTLLQAVREPLGVVCVITPWNFPIAIPAWKLAPALMYGNTVVFKPAEIASGTAVMLAELLQEAGLPDGVLNLLTGYGGELSTALLGAPELDGVTFTGSNAVGRQIAAAAAGAGVKTQLELGGKNPSVVLADADLERATGCITRSAMLSTGQRCTATSRAIVVDELFDELAQRLVDAAERLVVGDPLEEQTEVGPLSGPAQYEKVTTHMRGADGDGLQLATGGQPGDPAGGYFVTPTIYIDVDPRHPVATEEIFGPVLALIRARDEADAIRLANDTRYGLSASVFTSDLRSAMRCAAELQAGVVHVNGETAGAEPHVPFGGVKGSSSGSREQGKAAREFFTELKTVYIEDL